MTIAIDFDQTWTLDPNGWTQFYNMMRHRGHKIIMATGRKGPATDMFRHNIPSDMDIVYCGGELKETATRKAGYKVDVWVDDMPGTIQECGIIKPAVDDEL